MHAAGLELARRPQLVLFARCACVAMISVLWHGFLDFLRVARNDNLQAYLTPCATCSVHRRGMADEDKKSTKEKPDTSIVVKILKTDMTEEMQNDIIEVTQLCIGKHKLHKDLASAIKGAFDVKHPPPDNKATSGVWHCVCGSDFAVSVTYETHYACYWEANNIKMLLWKSKDSPFD